MTTGYVFNFGGRVCSPDGAADIDIGDIDEHNQKLDSQVLTDWLEKPDAFGGYVSDDDRFTTWLGKTLGRVIITGRYRNNLGATITCLRVLGTNGCDYHGRYGSDWSQFVRVRRTK